MFILLMTINMMSVWGFFRRVFFDLKKMISWSKKKKKTLSYPLQLIGANCKLCNAMLLQQKKTYCNLKPTKFHYRYLNSTKFHRSEHHHFPKVPLICSSLSISTPQQGISITCLLSTLPNLDIDSTWFNMIQHDSTNSCIVDGLPLEQRTIANENS